MIRWRTLAFAAGTVVWVGLLAWAAVTAPGRDYVWAAHYPAQVLRGALAIPVVALVAAGAANASTRQLGVAAGVLVRVIGWPLMILFLTLSRIGRLNQWELGLAMGQRGQRGPLDPDS